MQITEDIGSRQVFDIPPLKIQVIEHQAERKTCACGHKNAAKFPDPVKSSLGYISSRSMLWDTSKYFDETGIRVDKKFIGCIRLVPISIRYTRYMKNAAK